MVENCPVTGIQVRTDHMGVKRVKAVETAHGTIQTPCVVNCAGETNELHQKRAVNNRKMPLVNALMLLYKQSLVTKNTNSVIILLSCQPV